MFQLNTNLLACQVICSDLICFYRTGSSEGVVLVVMDSPAVKEILSRLMNFNSPQKRPVPPLPPGILPEIFKRLPVRYVLRCRCVQKSWYRVIHSSSFITLHLNYQINSQRKRYLLFHSNYSSYSIHSDNNKCRLSYNWYPNVSLTSYGTSGGLICLSDLCLDYSSHIYLWNPAIRMLKALPPSSFFSNIFVLDFKGYVYKLSLAFGYSPHVDDYKVVKVMIYCMEEYAKWLTVVDVYSLRSNSWKRVGGDLSCCKLSRPVFINGAAYWVAKKSHGKKIIVCFDTENEIFREILLPQYDCLYKLNYFVQEFCESLCVFVNHRPLGVVDVWVMEEADVWKKKTSINLGGIYGLPMGFRSNGQMVLRMLNEFGYVSYNLEKDKAEQVLKSQRLRQFGYINTTSKDVADSLDQKVYFVNPFMESLLLLDDKLGF